MRCYRMQPDDQDPAGLLTEEGRWTAPWGGSEDGELCDKCEGGGSTRYECWSCLLTGPREDCPACEARVRWEDRCSVCRGTGRIDGKPRHGVSVFPTVEGLYHYMLAEDADIEGCNIVELEAERAEDADFDADQGAMLVIPSAILRCAPADGETAERVRRLIAAR